MQDDFLLGCFFLVKKDLSPLSLAQFIIFMVSDVPFIGNVPSVKINFFPKLSTPLDWNVFS